MSTAPSIVARLHSPFLCCPLKLSSFSSPKSRFNHRPSPLSYPSIRAIDLDQNTVVAVSVGLVSVAVGIGVPVFYETQIDNAAKRENTQPCFPCSGSGAQESAHGYIGKQFVLLVVVIVDEEARAERCRFCLGSGSVTVELGGGDKEVSPCINCDGAGSLTCTTCQGTGIQPRYLDRREFKDDD